jgi:hypothetical protein
MVDLWQIRELYGLVKIMDVRVVFILNLLPRQKRRVLALDDILNDPIDSKRSWKLGRRIRTPAPRGELI